MQCGENMSDTNSDMPAVDPNAGIDPADPAAQAAPAAPTEPTLDHSMFRMELGKIEDVISHIKEWVSWKLNQKG